MLVKVTNMVLLTGVHDAAIDHVAQGQSTCKRVLPGGMKSRDVLRLHVWCGGQF